MSKLKLRPTFKSDAQEAAFWGSHDSTEYINYSDNLSTAQTVGGDNFTPASKVITGSTQEVDQQARCSLSEALETVSA